VSDIINSQKARVVRFNFLKGFLKFIKTLCIGVNANALIRKIGKFGKLSKGDVEVMIVDGELD
ncbi:hypothetical protein Tco_0827384, partial [Tanacetum coccineum]